MEVESTTIAADIVSSMIDIYEIDVMDEQHCDYLHSHYQDLCDRIKTLAETTTKTPVEFTNHPELLEMYNEFKQDQLKTMVIRDAYREVAGRGRGSLYDRVHGQVQIVVDQYDLPKRVHEKLLQMTAEDMRQFMYGVQTEEWEEFYHGECGEHEEHELDEWIAKYSVEYEWEEESTDDGSSGSEYEYYSDY